MEENFKTENQWCVGIPVWAWIKLSVLDILCGGFRILVAHDASKVGWGICTYAMPKPNGDFIYVHCLGRVRSGNVTILS